MKTLVVIFDGLDFELIKEFGLDSMVQEEFGPVDNDTGVAERKTCELHASLITGELYHEHGVRGLKKWDNKYIDNLDSWLAEKGFEGKRGVLERIALLIGADRRKYRREDLRSETVFDRTEDSKTMFVPVYSPSIFWMVDADLAPLKKGYSLEDTMDYYDSREFSYRKEAVFEELETRPKNLLMVHFHRPDIFQHLYGDNEIGSYDEQKLKEMYMEADELAAKIKQKALEAGYERIIFMSDHGLPEGSQHNRNAFYSSNLELFGPEKPHITDFSAKLESSS